MPQIKTDFDGLVRLLAKNLYPEPDVFIRELIQNGHDAIQFRRAEDRHLNGRLDIETDARQRQIRFLDNGLGMNAEDIDAFLSTIGTSGTGQRAIAEGDKGRALSTIGQFGIGFLSAFVVAEKIEVVTRKVGTTKVLRWVCHGGDQYELDEIEDGSVDPGTRVTLSLPPDKAHHLDEALAAPLPRNWVRCFVMMPYGREYEKVESALRVVLQGSPYYFEVVLARDHVHYEDLRYNLRQHIRDADFYVADVSNHSPNVLLELGWPFFDPELEQRPRILLKSNNGKNLPVDLASLVCIEYEDSPNVNLEIRFRNEFMRNKRVNDLLSSRKERFLSPELLEGLPFLPEVYRELLCERYSTVEALLNVTKEYFGKSVPPQDTWLLDVLNSIQDHLKSLD